MDEAALKKILQETPVPHADENARKMAVNLAVAAFKVEQTKKAVQGNSFLSRLIGRSMPNEERNRMSIKKKGLVLGGLAGTALAAFLINAVMNERTLNLPQASQAMHQSYETKGSVSVAKNEIIDFASSYEGNIDKKSAPEADSEMIVAQTQADDAAKTPAYRREQTNLEADTQASALPSKKTDNLGGLLKDVTPPFESAEIGERKSKSADLDRAAPEPLSEMAANKIQEQSRISGNGYPGETKEAEAIAPQVRSIAPASPPMMTIMPDDQVQSYYQDEGRDKFEHVIANPFKLVAQEPVSTFSSDVDTASYSFVRRLINSGQLPPQDSVRVEEMINYFDYDYPLPESKEEPFKPTVTVIDSPWSPGRKLMHIGIRGYEIAELKPRSNLVFLVDVSGSMNSPDKLPLLVNSLKMLVDSLQPEDTVAIVVYAGAAGTVLEPTKVSERSRIYSALDALQAGGSTAGAAGIEQAYSLAGQNYREESVNRVILATDGDFNVGVTSNEQLKQLVEQKRKQGIFLSVLGFGEGNYNDSLMQTLAQNGNGVAAYIDTLNEARKVLLEEASSTLYPIAKDVKFQIEFNPNTVSEYRLIGYETRALQREDFNNDRVDAGDMGAGHTVTAIYEFVPAGSGARTIDDLRYADVRANKLEEKTLPTETKADDLAQEKAQSINEFSDEWAFLKIRYKLPNQETSHLMTTPVTLSSGVSLTNTSCATADSCGTISNDVRFSVAVAAFGQILKGEYNMQDFSLDQIIAMAQEGKGDDKFGYRSEFIQMVRLAKTLMNR